MLTNGQTVAEVTVPDIKLARDGTEPVREPATDQRANFVDLIENSDWRE
jgi:hypothetical protein